MSVRDMSGGGPPRSGRAGLAKLAPVERWATFDCYGTLIDWNGGIRGQLARLWGEGRADELLHRYHQVEPQVESDAPGMAYRDVMATVLARLGDVPAGEDDAL